MNLTKLKYYFSILFLFILSNISFPQIDYPFEKDTSLSIFKMKNLNDYLYSNDSTFNSFLNPNIKNESIRDLEHNNYNLDSILKSHDNFPSLDYKYNSLPSIESVIKDKRISIWNIDTSLNSMPNPMNNYKLPWDKIELIPGISSISLPQINEVNYNAAIFANVSLMKDSINRNSYFVINGTTFFINDSTALTCNHILNKKTFFQNGIYNGEPSMIINEVGNKLLFIYYSQITEYPELDLTIIHFNNKIELNNYCKISNYNFRNFSVTGIGFDTANHPKINIKNFSKGKADIGDLRTCRKKKVGQIKSYLFCRMNDNLSDSAFCFEAVMNVNVGMSGGPVIDNNTGDVIGMMIAGWPPNSHLRTKVFAITINEIKVKLNK